jgi:hypothetical protein
VAFFIFRKGEVQMSEEVIQQPGEPGGTDQNQPIPWLEQVEESLRGNEVLRGFNGPNALAKAHLEKLEEVKNLRGDLEARIKLPGHNATQEEREAFYRSIGKPEKAEEYEFPQVEGQENNPQMVEWAQKTFHEANLSKDQAAQIGKSWNAFMEEMVKADTEAKEKAEAEAETKIKAELGEQYAEAFELTRRLLSENATPEELAFLDESGAGNSPVIAKLIFKLAKLTGEDKSPPRGGNPQDQVKVGMNYTSMAGFKGY